MNDDADTNIDLTARIVTRGLHFGEGPRWHGGRLWFSDFYHRAVKSMGVDGELRTELTLEDDQPSGLGWLPDGRLLVVAMHRRQVLRLDAGGLALHGDLSGIAAFHANDMVVDGQGGAYVGNFGFDLDAAMKTRGVKDVLADHPTARLARIDANGVVSEAASDLNFPNGTVITPDGRVLIIAETLAMRLTAFDRGPDGSLSNRRVWAMVGMRAPDGICLDANGHVWIANAIAPECVQVTPGGRIVATVRTSQPCFACMLGGPERRTLYMMTAPSSSPDVVRPAPRGAIECVEVETPGAGWP
jgi:sugar lactone lactonase YvrE